MAEANTKSENLNSKQNLNSKSQKTTTYDLEERTFLFANRVNDYVNKLPYSVPNNINGKQLIRAGGSIGANYIEANESLGKKDFQMRIKISKKESKEARYWLRLSDPIENETDEKDALVQESTELMKIFGSILEKSKNQTDV